VPGPRKSGILTGDTASVLRMPDPVPRKKEVGNQVTLCPCSTQTRLREPRHTQFQPSPVWVHSFGRDTRAMNDPLWCILPICMIYNKKNSTTPNKERQCR
jgi:hypothetical protein